MKISKETYRSLFRLYKRQEWLTSREDKLLQTLDLCKTIDEQNLLTDLLHRFVYVNGEKLKECFLGIADLICCEWKLDKTRTQLVATTADYEPDSAQLMLQVLKPLLPERGWANVKKNNNFTRSFKDLSEFPIVVLIDEFSGTGKTLLSRIKNLKREAYLRGKSLGTMISLEIYVAVMASMEDVRPVVGNHCAKFEAQIWLKKGISGHSVGDELDTAIRNMIRLESMLQQNLLDVHFPSFGFGEAEALYSLDNANTPNSVFPIFWWRYLRDGTQRAPLLDRQDPNIP